MTRKLMFMCEDFVGNRRVSAQVFTLTTDGRGGASAGIELFNLTESPKLIHEMAMDARALADTLEHKAVQTEKKSHPKKQTKGVRNGR